MEKEEQKKRLGGVEEEGENGARSKGTSKFHVGRTPASFTIESLPINALPST